MAYGVSREFIIKPACTMGRQFLAPSWAAQARFRNQ
jgi:hypothetical protein